jgi:hypothetical protein
MQLTWSARVDILKINLEISLKVYICYTHMYIVVQELMKLVKCNIFRYKQYKDT